MRIRTLVALAAGFVLLASCAHIPERTHEAEIAALAAAESWLELADEEKYGDCWEGTAEYFRSIVTRENCQQALQAFRMPLGPALSRKVKSRRYSTTLPGAPDGEYVTIEYETSFEKKRSAIETVIPMLDSDGQWRVSGYYVE